MMPLERINLQKTLSPLEWLVGGLILQGYINTIASLPGEGKTALLTGLAWQTSRMNGVFLDHRVAHGVTLYVDFDAPGDGRTVRYWLDKHQRAFEDGDLNKIIVLEPSHVLTSIGLSREAAYATIRVGLGRDTSHETIRKTVEVLAKAHANLTTSSAT